MCFIVTTFYNSLFVNHSILCDLFKIDWGSDFCKIFESVLGKYNRTEGCGI